MTSIHNRTYRVENIDNLVYSKTIIVKVSLDRYKEWELTIKDLDIKVNSNKINYARKEVKQKLLELHQKYLEDSLEEELKNSYFKYIIPYSRRAKTPQSENVKKLREENRKLKQENKDNE